MGSASCRPLGKEERLGGGDECGMANSAVGYVLRQRRGCVYTIRIVHGKRCCVGFISLVKYSLAHTGPRHQRTCSITHPPFVFPHHHRHSFSPNPLFLGSPPAAWG